MTDITFNHYPHFFTATILEWKHLLSDDEMKNIIVSSLDFLVADKRIKVYDFAPMASGVPNHIHIICPFRKTCGGKLKMRLKNGKNN